MQENVKILQERAVAYVNADSSVEGKMHRIVELEEGRVKGLG